MTNYMRINRICVAPAKRQVIYSIKKVGLSLPIMTNETIDFGRKRKTDLLQIFIVNYRDCI